MLKNIVAKMLRMTKTRKEGLMSNDEKNYLLGGKTSHRSAKRRILSKLHNCPMERIVGDIELILRNREKLGLTHNEIRAFLRKMYSSPEVISSYCDGLKEEEKLETALYFIGNFGLEIGEVFPTALQQAYDEQEQAMKKTSSVMMHGLWEWDRLFSQLGDKEREQIWSLFRGKINPSATGKFAKYTRLDNERCRTNRLIAQMLYQKMRNDRWIKFSDIWNSVKKEVAKRPLSSLLNILHNHRLIEKRGSGKATRYSITKLGANIFVRVQSHDIRYRCSDAPFFEEIKKRMMELLEARAKKEEEHGSPNKTS